MTTPCMSFGDLLLVSLAAGVVVMALAYLIARRRSDMGWVDAGWTVGLVTAALGVTALAGGHPGRRALVAVFVTLWGGRLSLLIIRRLLTRSEDSRYRSLREHWGPRTRLYMPLLFAVEACLTPVFAVPLIAVARLDRPPGVWDFLAGAVWLTAFAGEWIADRQLARFRASTWNRGKTCREGLWRYSRHPNYFFEWVHWWTYVVMAAGTLAILPALAGPALMALFLIKLTGIPHAERQALAHRGEDYCAYQRTTNAFFPWWPRESDEQVRG